MCACLCTYRSNMTGLKRIWQQVKIKFNDIRSIWFNEFHIATGDFRWFQLICLNNCKCFSSGATLWQCLVTVISTFEIQFGLWLAITLRLICQKLCWLLVWAYHQEGLKSCSCHDQGLLKLHSHCLHALRVKWHRSGRPGVERAPTVLSDMDWENPAIFPDDGSGQLVRGQNVLNY